MYIHHVGVIFGNLLIYYRPQRSSGKVMFLQGCVILLTGGGEYLTRYLPRPGTPPGTNYPPGPGTPPRIKYTPRTRYTLPQVHPPGPGRYGIRAGGTHPTGMHSCLPFFPDIMREMIWKDQLLYLWIVWCLRILTWLFGIIAGIIGFYLRQYPGSYHQDNQH